ncbi:phosphatidylinositol 4,5-bisphosphate-binding protein [Kalmusia sp. IMI 367209]|nr:phosphatidylinositol 4,5-bisphosphate-binding protein [Kalmusia sp. IMI 367209]
MASQRPITPSGGYNSIPTPSDPTHLSRGYGANPHLGVDGNDFATTPANPIESSPLSQSLNRHESLGSRFEENFDARTRGSSVIGDGDRDIPARSHSRASTLGNGAASATPSRSGTLKKRASVKRSGSLKRSGSRRSVRAGSIKGVNFEDEDGGAAKHNSVFYTPVPTSGSPTEILANRFQAWRKLLKDLISYFREVGASYEHRSKALLKVSNVINNTNAPALFLSEGGLNDANRILRDYHKQATTESNKAKDIETEVVNQLSGLRADLGQKIKEIKSLSGDFKNSVDKEKENTRKAVAALEESLALIDSDPAAVAGKGDPFVVRLGVERQVERQIDEENYLHRAYLNLENSGRELESIVVGEIQKAYNALASIMKREADENYSTIERLRSGPVGMPRDLEWNQFVTNDPHFVNPHLPLRRLEDIEYPGKHHPAAAEVRAGMLERKSKYLKSYTPGWAETYDTMLAWYDDINSLIDKTGDERNAFVTRHKRSMSRGSARSISSDGGLEEDEADRVPFSANQSVTNQPVAQESELPSRPSPGGRFPSDLQVDRSLQARGPSSGSSSEVGLDLATAAGGLQTAHASYPNAYDDRTPMDAAYGPGNPYEYHPERPPPQVQQQTSYYANNAPATPGQNYLNNAPAYPDQTTAQPATVPFQAYQPAAPAQLPPPPAQQEHLQQYPTLIQGQRHVSNYGEWMAPAAGGAAAGALGAEALHRHQQKQEQQHEEDQINAALATPTQPAAGSNPYSQTNTIHSASQAISQHENAGLVAPVPAPLPADLTFENEIDSLATTPSVAREPFLGAAGTDGKMGNGEPVLNPGVRRQNTDFSVSDLHVPGEYPKVRKV